MRQWCRFGLLVLCALLAVACPKGASTKQADPIEEEKKALDARKALAVRGMSSGDPTAEAQGLIYLEIEAQARLRRYIEDHPAETQTGTLSPESIQIRTDVGRYLSELRQRKYHTTPAALELKIQGLTPLGKTLNELSTDLLLPEGAPSTQPGNVRGQVNLLKLYFYSIGALDITRITPPPAERAQLSLYGIEAYDAMLEILAAPNFAALATVKKDKVAGFKRQIKTGKKQLAKYAKK